MDTRRRQFKAEVAVIRQEQEQTKECVQSLIKSRYPAAEIELVKRNTSQSDDPEAKR